MNLLYSNDRQGHYPDSWYAATATPLAPCESLKGRIKADVCIVGAGYTGLSAALHLAEAGLDVVVLEAHRIGFGASGRNGGQLGAGQRMEQNDLVKLVGNADADKLWHLAEEAKDLVKSLIAKHKIDCYLKPGVAHIGLNTDETKELHWYADYLNDRYGYDSIQKLDREQSHALCPDRKSVV